MYQEGLVATGIWVASFLAAFLLSSCAPAPYRLCDAQHCSKSMTHEEALKAAEVSDAWKERSDIRLKVAPVK